MSGEPEVDSHYVRRRNAVKGCARNVCKARLIEKGKMKGSEW